MDIVWPLNFISEGVCKEMWQKINKIIVIRTSSLRTCAHLGIVIYPMQRGEDMEVNIKKRQAVQPSRRICTC